MMKVICQMLVSNYLRDFSKQVAFGVVAAFVGLVLLMVFEPIGRIYPFSQAALALRARELTDFSAGDLILFLAVNIIFIVAFLELSIRKLQNREF
ncbi:ABC-2 family transporter permease [Lactovum odontotermitis]